MKKVIVTLLILILIAILGFGGYMIWKLNDKIDDQSSKIENILKGTNSNSVNNEVDTTTNVTTNTSDENNIVNNVEANESIDDQIKRAYLKKLKEAGFDDYRVDNVEVLNEERTKEIIEWDNGQYYKSGDVLAIVTYAVSPAEYGMAGNGEQSGNWVINKTACISFRDGQIVSDGTSW